MENILKEINVEIKKIVSSEEIDTQKLIELINIRDRLKGYDITNVSQLQEFNQVPTSAPIGAYPIHHTHRNNSSYDTVMDIANVFLKYQTKQIDNKNINDLIHYHKFISELEPSTEIETMTERFEIKNDIEELIMKEFKIIIDERKNKEKDRIINTSLESKSEVQT